MTHPRSMLPSVLAVLVVLGAESHNTTSAADGATEELFVAKPFTAPGSFTGGVEGPACDAQGNLYAVNFARQQTIGRVTPDGRASLFVELPGRFWLSEWQR